VNEIEQFQTGMISMAELRELIYDMQRVINATASMIERLESLDETVDCGGFSLRVREDWG